MIFSIIALCVTITLLHFFITFTYGKKKTNIKIIDTINQIINDEKLEIRVEEKNESPYYDAEKKLIVMPGGENALNVGTGFHELGHYYDDLDKNYEGEYSTLQYYFMKYSILVAILSFYGIILYPYPVTFIIGILFSLVSVYFFTVALREEIGATKHAKILMKKYISLTKNEQKSVYLSLYSALSTYIALLIVSLLVLCSNVYSVAINYIG